MSILDEDDLYIILGIDESASIAEISRAYKELAKRFHPDKFVSYSEIEREKINKIFTKITNAFNILKEPQERALYDCEKELRQKIKTTNNINYIVINEQQAAVTTPERNFIDIQVNNLNKSKLTNESKEKKVKKEKNLFEKSLKEYKNGMLDDALSDLRALIELNPQIAIYHSYLGLTMKKKSWNGYAQAEFKVALNYDPKDKIALKNYKPSNSVKNRTKKTNIGLLDKIKSFFKSA